MRFFGDDSSTYNTAADQFHDLGASYNPYVSAGEHSLADLSHRYGQMLQDPQYLMTFRLHAGECIVFDNHRIAHGRASYEEGSGARHLRGCYVDRGELRSTYRVLRAKHCKVECEN